ncbi:ribonuclease HI [Nevskia soli]|jgi:ribonuclease HI|uniref:ribonuclease HI n=1 Tax=Nevskia soli TaxID=418856 RepID=UPI0015D8C886|nr:ribonuclease HI [Nevskia soli]
MKKVQLITDGSCIGNPGRGGWACVLRFGEHVKEMYGSSQQTTNNRMELTAALEGLRTLNERCEVDLVTDSEYLRNGMTKWMANWKRRGWMTAEKKPVINRDLWEALDQEVARHEVKWVWTRGHASHDDNNRADELANAAARGQLQQR